MSTSAYENAAAMLRKQQRTTARLRVGLPALLAHFEHTELLPPEPSEEAEPSEQAEQAEQAEPLDHQGRSDARADHDVIDLREADDRHASGSARPAPPADR